LCEHHFLLSLCYVIVADPTASTLSGSPQAAEQSDADSHFQDYLTFL